MAGTSQPTRTAADDSSKDATFHRPPRAWPDPPPSDALRMHAPPPKPEPPSGGLMYAAMPAVGSFGLIAFAFVYDNPLFIYIGVGMAFLAVLLAIGIRVSQARSVKKKRTRNRRRYLDYLTSIERQLTHDADLQLAAGDRLYPDHERLWGLVLSRRHLWERRAHDPDYLEHRRSRRTGAQVGLPDRPHGGRAARRAGPRRAPRRRDRRVLLEGIGRRRPADGGAAGGPRDLRPADGAPERPQHPPPDLAGRARAGELARHELPAPPRRADRRAAPAALRDDRGRLAEGRRRQDDDDRPPGGAAGAGAP